MNKFPTCYLILSFDVNWTSSFKQQLYDWQIGVFGSEMKRGESLLGEQSLVSSVIQQNCRYFFLAFFSGNVQ